MTTVEYIIERKDLGEWRVWFTPLNRLREARKWVKPCPRTHRIVKVTTKVTTKREVVK